MTEPETGGATPGTGSAAAEADVPGVVARPPLIYLTGILAGLLLARVHRFPALPVALKPAGWALIAGALALMLWAVREFRRAGTSFHPTHPSSAIISAGPYRFTRNPLYIGLTAITAGIALLRTQAWILVTLVPTLLVMHYGVILREERYLTRKFGKVYTDYRAKVRRWI